MDRDFVSQHGGLTGKGHQARCGRRSRQPKASAQIAGLGIGHLPRWLAAPEIATGRLVDLPLAETRQELPINIAWRSRQVGRALAWFLDRLADEATRRQLTTGI